MNRFSFSTTENYPEWSLLLTWVAVASRVGIRRGAPLGLVASGGVAAREAA